MSISTQILPQATQEHLTARAYFPRGLFQPDGSFRFSLDALLLASLFQAQEADKTVLDLGTGCGVVALGMLCRFPWLHAVGLDMQEQLVEAAKKNAQQLGFSESFLGIHGDMRKIEQNGVFDTLLSNKQHTYANGSLTKSNSAAKNILTPENVNIGDTSQRPDNKFDIVLANPPYRKRGTGRLPANESRCLALFEDGNTLQAFCRIASQAVSAHGRVGMIYPVERKKDLFEALITEGLQPVSLLFVQSRQEDSPFLFLVTAQKAVIENEETEFMKKGSIKESSLILYEGTGTETMLTRDATAFCPWLACNTKRF